MFKPTHITVNTETGGRVEVDKFHLAGAAFLEVFDETMEGRLRSVCVTLTPREAKDVAMALLDGVLR